MAQYGRGSSYEFARASEIRMDDESGGWIVSSVDPLGTNPDMGELFRRWADRIHWSRGQLEAARAFTEAIRLGDDNLSANS